MQASTRTAEEAARAVGCRVEQIVKSLVFVGEDGACWLVLASGGHAVDPARLQAVVGTNVRLADASTVRASTGFAIGGVAPVGLTSDVPVIMDETLLALGTVWAAAGSPNAVFSVDARDLARVTGARIVGVA